MTGGYTVVKSVCAPGACPSIAPVVTLLCRPHRRPGVAECAACGDAVCDACAAETGDRCRQCAAVRSTARTYALMGRESRTVMRRSGIPVHRERGDPVVLHEGPLRLALPLGGVVASVVGAAVVAALIQRRFGVDVAFTGIGLALFVGIAVRSSFGGVSAQAGLVAALSCVAAVAFAQRFAGTQVDSTVAFLGTASIWLAEHSAAAAGCYALAAFLAYGAAAGRRVV